tara:strand:- start:70 stop:309 length:240 start_codon:yes stop_codon:yes gene_type:complete
MNIFTHILIKFIKIYKYFISPFISPSCRYLPTCSDYSIEALRSYGFFKGLMLSLKRIMSCHPWGNSGFDPVKKEMKVKK